MQATYEATTWGIQAGINASMLEKRTVSWLERKPGNKRRTRKTRTFTCLASYDQTDNLLAIRGLDAHEDEIDGHMVMVFMLRGNCVGIWYNARSTGSFCLDFQGDDMCYAGDDPFWPWQD